MIGGGFLGQMHQTMKNNREILRNALKKKKKEAFQKGDYKKGQAFNVKGDERKLTELERQELLESITSNNIRERNRKIALLVVSILILFCAYLIVDHYWPL